MPDHRPSHDPGHGPDQRSGPLPAGPVYTAVGADWDFVNYQVGAFGPRAIYELENVRGDVNTNMTGTTGGHYFVNASVASGFPNANAVYDLW